MTVLERRNYRDAVLQRALERAYRQAGMHRLTERCQRAMLITGTSPAAAREMHQMCKGEEPGNSGCLCMCHDVSTNTVESGAV
jgi:hypothetical protein